MSFITRLEYLMKKNGISSKAELAKLSGIPYTTIDGFYKKGTDNIKLSTLRKLTPSDIDGNSVRVSKAMVRDKDNFWVVKPVPKTDESNRTITLPGFVVKMIPIPDKGRIIKARPEQISNRFRRAVRSCGCERRFRLHDLRHYYVSIAHALGVPDAYIMQMGGWKTDNIMKRVYRDTLPDVMRAEQDKMTEHFKDVFGA